MRSFLSEFKQFALRGNVVDLAVGVVIGAAFTAVTTSLVNNVLTPPLGLLIGGIDFKNLGFRLGGEAVIAYGLFIQAVISFIITAFVLFLFVKFINKLVRIAREEQQDGVMPEAQKTPEVQILEEIRDILNQR